MKSLVPVMVAGMILASPALAMAQQAGVTPSDRPYRGLFGGGVGDAEQLLALRASLGGGFDDNVLAGSSLGGGTASLFRARRGRYGHGFVGLNYAINKGDVSINALGQTAARYFPDLSDTFVRSDRGEFTVSWPAGRQTRLSAGASATYRPYSLLGLFPAAAPAAAESEAPDEDFAIAGEHYLTYAARTGLTRQIGQRTTLGLDYAHARSEFSGDVRDHTTNGAGGSMQFALTRGLSAQLGYRYRQRGHEGDPEVLRTHGLSAGVGYDRRLSLTRKTTLSIGSGSSAVTSSARTIYRITGQAGLNREIGRTWNGAIHYDRNVALVETFDEPFYYDALALSLEGLVHRRVHFQALASAAKGTVGLTRLRPHDTYGGLTRLTFALSRHVAATASYRYYHYKFASGVELPAGVPSQLDRHGVRVDLSLWAPLFYRAGRPDAVR